MILKLKIIGFIGRSLEDCCFYFRILNILNVIEVIWEKMNDL